MLLVPLDFGVPADQAERVLLRDDGDCVERDEGLMCPIVKNELSVNVERTRLDGALANMVGRDDRGAEGPVLEDLDRGGVDLGLGL